MTRRIKILLIGAAAISLIGLCLFLFFYHPQKLLEVDFLDVGQGDAILIKTPYGQNILIDGGPDKTILRELGENLAWYDRKIDLIILTHPHDDHVTGLVEVLKRYKADKILYTGVSHNSPNYLKWLEIIKEKKIPLEIVDKKQKIILGEGAYLEIVYPLKSFLNKEADNLNNTSIVVKLIHGQNNFLFTGDIEKEIEEELLKNKTDLRADVLKIAHHGSNTSSGEEFLEAVSPKMAIIPVGAENSFGFPSLLIIRRLERLGVKIFRSDLDENVKFLSDSEKIYVR